MHRLLVLGMNHATAPLSLRERAAFSAEQAQAALTDIQQRYAAEAVIVSTCNRVELYLARPVHAQPRIEQLHQLLADLKGIPVVEVQAHTYNHTDHAAAQHLFRVTCSLDSMVVGEDQILAQVRQAYELAHKSGVTGPILNGLFQRALACGKAVRTQTALAEGRLSIASVAVDHARQIFEDFSDKTLLCLGAGKMALLLLKHLRELKPGRLIIANRDAAKAAVVAEQFGGSPVGLDRLPEALVSADIVLTSTHSAEPVITHAMFEPLCRARRFRPIFFIDIALPRDVEPAVGELDNVYLYNIDDLQTVVAQTQKTAGRPSAPPRRSSTARWPSSPRGSVPATSGLSSTSSMASSTLSPSRKPAASPADCPMPTRPAPISKSSPAVSSTNCCTSLSAPSARTPPPPRRTRPRGTICTR